MRACRCSFCGRDEKQVAKLVAGPRVFICDVCVAEATRLMNAPPPDDDLAQAPRLRRSRNTRLVDKWRHFFGKRHLERKTASA